MKDKELAIRLIDYPYFGEHTMRIKLDQPSVAVSASAGVEIVYSGIDWDNGVMFIKPDEPLVSWAFLESIIPDIHEQIKAH